MSFPIEETAARFWGAVWDWVVAIHDGAHAREIGTIGRQMAKAFERHEDELILRTIVLGRDPRPKKRRKKK